MAFKQFTCRFEKSVDDAIDKITIKENTTKNKVMNKIIQMGLDAYFKKNETSENDKIEKKLAPRFDEIEQKMQFFSDQMKDLDLKSYRMNIFITDFAQAFFEGNEKFISLNNDVLNKVKSYRIQIKYIPKLGWIVLKYMQNILKQDIPDQFYSDIKDTHIAMNKKDF